MNALEKPIIAWFAENKRKLPWRNTTPWGVMVSEFMLQQTPVVRVQPKWEEWMLRWPTPALLAKATPAEIITAWGRLGYPRRALRLFESAKVITRDFKGVVPRDEISLRTLPGVGDYTAAAIAAFAFQERSVVLDVNIRRLFSRSIDGNEFPTSSPSKVERQLREKLLPQKGAHLWAAATMELGALICTAKNPKCESCPIKAQCLWRKSSFPKSTKVRKSQSWHGTDRQCRGTIVQALRESPSLTKKELTALWHEDSQIEKALASLIVDGLIVKEASLYLLPNL
ncbi:MAG: hypothetical protein NTU82_00595 [Actinobacteria bacterium]|nr:hypothetical protein [Actinomycetota bacterium]